MEELILKVKNLIKMHKQGLLGGEIMPEDANPNLPLDSEENYIYFTLPMALNYQRDSYKLWQSALKTYTDPDTKCVFNMVSVVNLPIVVLSELLLKYKVALQPNKQPVIWQTLCKTFVEKFNGSIKCFFENCDFDIVKIKNYILNHKKDFPYLSGTKILNYWLYVMANYTNVKFKNVQEISVAPDTHVLKASVKLGVITEQDLNNSNVRELVSKKWKQILNGTGIYPIQIHTPFWLWSRNGFRIEP